jgi:hypothetical protein
MHAGHEPQPTATENSWRRKRMSTAAAWGSVGNATSFFSSVGTRALVTTALHQQQARVLVAAGSRGAPSMSMWTRQLHPPSPAHHHGASYTYYYYVKQACVSLLQYYVHTHAKDMNICKIFWVISIIISSTPGEYPFGYQFEYPR